MEALALQQLVITRGKHSEEVERWIAEIRLLLTNGDEVMSKLPRDPYYQGEYKELMKWLQDFRCYGIGLDMPFIIQPRNASRNVSVKR